MVVVDTHVTTLITAVILFQFGTGPIKGFAVSLSMGVAINPVYRAGLHQGRVRLPSTQRIR